MNQYLYNANEVTILLLKVISPVEKVVMQKHAPSVFYMYSQLVFMLRARVTCMCIRLTRLTEVYKSCEPNIKIVEWSQSSPAVAQVMKFLVTRALGLPIKDMLIKNYQHQVESVIERVSELEKKALPWLVRLEEVSAMFTDGELNLFTSVSRREQVF